MISMQWWAAPSPATTHPFWACGDVADETNEVPKLSRGLPNLQFSSRMSSQALVADSWTCCRSMDGTKVQISATPLNNMNTGNVVC